MPPNRYLIISSFQKALRRGLADQATILWEHLKNVDRFFARLFSNPTPAQDDGAGGHERLALFH